MPLTSKLKADYLELINEQLDHMPIESVDEFDLIKEALSNINTPIAGYSVPEALRERISDVSEILNSPELYVESNEDYAAYQQIIRDRIKAKVLEFQSFSEEQKLAYIQSYRQRQTKQQDQKRERVMDDRRYYWPQDITMPGRMLEHPMATDQQKTKQQDQKRERVMDDRRYYWPRDITMPGRMLEHPMATDQQKTKQQYQKREWVMDDDGLYSAPDITMPGRMPERMPGRMPGRMHEPPMPAMATDQQISHAVELTEGRYSTTDLIGISAAALEHLTTPNAISALQNNVFTAHDLIQRSHDLPSIKRLVSQLVTQALSDRCYTLDDFDRMVNTDHVRFLTNPDFVGALRSGVFTIDDVIPLENRVITQLIHPRCLEALQNGRTRLELLTGMTAEEITSANQTGEYPMPPQPSL